MLHLQAFDVYRPRASAVHQLDARVKLVVALAFIIATVLIPDGVWPALILQEALALGVVVLSQLGVGFVLQRAAVALPFALAAVTLVFSVPGAPLATLALGRLTLTLTDAGLVRFISIMLKAWMAAQAAIVLAAATQFPALLQALRALYIPRVLVAMVGFTYRYLFVIADEALRMLRARSARSGASGRSGGGIVWRAQVAGGMAGSLFLRSLERSERIYDAMVARGYDGEVRMHETPRLAPGALMVGASALVVLALVQFLARVGW
jgi:cobalt/nickel transport system permease protein